MIVLSPSRSAWRRLADIVFPWREAIAPSASAWLLHGLFWGIVLVALWQLNRWLGLERGLHSPWPIVRQVWLPLLVMLIYALGWLCVAMWRALRCLPPTGAWPDVEEAWDEAWRLLEQDSANTPSTPLFLIIGAFTSDLQAMLESAGATCILSHSATPLHVFRNAEANFVVYETCSLSGDADHALENNALHHLCRLLRRDRSGRHALQGIVLSVTMDRLQDETQTQKITACFQEEVRAIRQATGLECPRFAVVTGLDNVPECVAQGWFQRFPLVPDQDPTMWDLQIRQGIDRLCLEKLPQMLRRRVRLDASPGAPGMVSDTLRENIHLYQFMGFAISWRARLCQFLGDNDSQGPGLVAGCYFLPGAAATLRESTVVPALVADLYTCQSNVTWSTAMASELKKDRTLIQNTHVLILAGWLSIFAIGSWLFMTHQ